MLLSASVEIFREHLKGYMLGFNLNNVMAGAKGVKKGDLRGPDGVKGPKVVYLGIIVISWLK